MMKVQQELETASVVGSSGGGAGDPDDGHRAVEFHQGPDQVRHRRQTIESGRLRDLAPVVVASTLVA